MKYVLNEKKTMEILENYSGLFKVVDNSIEYSNIYSYSTNDNIENIKNKKLDKNRPFIENALIEVLHNHFNECFEEVAFKYDYQNCRAFLESLGYDCSVGMVEVLNERVCLNVVVNYLNGEREHRMTMREQHLAQLLEQNKEKVGE